MCVLSAVTRRAETMSKIILINLKPDSKKSFKSLPGTCVGPRRLKISFDDTLTSTYEYPSENYLLEEAGLLPAETTEGPSASQGGLASYTPSKIQIGSTFELGVSRTAPTVQTSPPAPPPQIQKAEDEYLRPADESETVTWSAESTSDMLF